MDNAVEIIEYVARRNSDCQESPSSKRRVTHLVAALPFDIVMGLPIDLDRNAAR